MNIEHDSGPLSWVKDEIELALTQVGERLQQYIARADAAALADARLHLHQASGALSIVGLNGVTEFALTIEQVLEALAEGSIQWSYTTNDAMQQALLALRQHLAGIVAGRPNQPLRLLPAYRQLNEARGIMHTTPGALFFPDLTQRPPKRAVVALEKSALRARHKAARLGFERGLAKLLHDDISQKEAGIRDMRNSIAIIEALQEQPGTRAFWWVALAYFDTLTEAGKAEADDTRHLCERIGVQVGKLLDGAIAVAERLMRDVLYEVATSAATSAQIEQVRLAYRLDEQVTIDNDEDTAPTSFTGEATQHQAMALVTRELRAELQQVEQGLDVFFRDPQRQEAIAHLPELLREIAFRFNRLGQARATTVALECVQQVADFLTADFPQRAGATDASGAGGAFPQLARTLSALSLFVDQMAHGHADLDALLAPAALAAVDIPPPQAAASVETELREQLRRLELNLRALNKLSPATTHDSSIQKILRGELHHILTTLRDDAQLVANILVEQHTQSALAALELAGSAATIGQIEAAVAPLLASQPPSSASSWSPVPDTERTQLLDPAAARAIDAELLSIFIEECQQQLEAARDALASLRAAPAEEKLLAALRRCFHTMKGSARMLGLKAFSDVAWAVESTLGSYLKAARPVSPPLLDMIDSACGIVAEWVRSLQTHAAPPDAEPLHRQCRALGEAHETPAVATEPAASPVAESAADVVSVASANAAEADALLKIGPLQLRESALEHFLAEARASLASLQLHWRRLPTPPMVAAVHTLEQLAIDLGFTSIQQVAGAFARALERFVDAHHGSDAAQDMALQMGLRRLGAMIKSVADRHYPRADEELASWIDALLPYRWVAAQDDAALRDAAGTKAGDALLSIFLEECDDLMPAVSAGFRSWRKEGSAGVDALLRGLHTLKGSARMAGETGLGEIVHTIETGIATAQADTAAGPDAELAPRIDELEAGFDVVIKRIDELRAAVRAEAQRPTLRVPADTLDAMVDESGEIAVMRAHIEGGTKVFRASLGDLNDNVARLRMQLRELEIQAESRIQAHSSPPGHDPASTLTGFDPLEMDRFTRLHELTRILAESVDDVATVQQGLVRHLDQVDDALTRQSRLSRSLTQRLLGVRMVPFVSIVERLQRVVLQTAAEAGKYVSLAIDGGETELDRSVLERITGPLEHLLRNAVVHGIESAEQRKAAGKSRHGEIRLTLAHVDNEVVISIGDDGAGLDFAHIRSEAARRGLLDAESANDALLGDEELVQLIYQPGFSTAPRLSEIAGRGIGMDVVRTETTALGGRIEVDNRPGQGLTFALHLPLTLAVIPVVLVKAGALTCAIPASMVVHADEVAPEAMAALRAQGGVQQQGQHYALHYFPRLLGDGAVQPQAQRRHWVLLLRGGVHHIALEVDALNGHEEVVIKNTGPQLARAPGVSGATLLGDGQIVLIINPVALASWHRSRMTRSHLGATEQTRLLQTQSRAPRAAIQTTVMVVDDSLTVRKISGRLLERAGYRVVTAKDGIDALAQLQQMADALPAVMLADIEMPRMDGFELVRRLRLDDRFKALPVIMITSRSADKHRKFAAELGADHYLGKPYDESALLALIADYASAQAARMKVSEP